uniref:FAD-binding PCMH-type domain-containing protein n=1 Tax=Chromera velia CCMP2878 TaxID=1169474 RepID=A0A0G4G791_9ALVE|eukprot:Cvel_20552.t1-p1 / transcript=Cvel_20552.t1 / gene=Cvel_20552 / organism=Chromera_velia_CCMP2878 / gene_product=D-2-hydroxyglutarate dehydrogenase, mitochondrial, putative / transcript_product=D-2-hydroxyglutarate dehydrogenase, mitochondrial, putative / location=Cvel_scaffold1855:3045-7107(+) / protein_length=541 / sequence_SO=supercontig / SO=protein_coding / is_pseudo=false
MLRSLRRQACSVWCRGRPAKSPFAAHLLAGPGIRSACAAVSFCPFSVSASPFRAPHFPRNPDFARVSEKDVAFFKSVCGSENVIEDEFELESFNTDWLGMYRGKTSVAVKPRSAEEVREVVRYCSEKKLAVCPQGGNTGLVGGSVPVFDEVVLSLKNLKKVVHFDEQAGILQCEAGCVLDDLNRFLTPMGFIMPVDLGAKGSCHIGGNVATNAGGLRLLRYGSMNATTLGLQVVTGSGRLLSLGSPLRKDNTGLKTHQLFVGSEGTLGVITKVTILCPPKPKSVQVCLFKCKSFEAVVKAAACARGSLGELLSALEFFDSSALSMVKRNIPGTEDPFRTEEGEGIGESPFFLLLETSGMDEESDASRLERAMSEMMETGLVEDGVVGSSEDQKGRLWALREQIGPAMSREGPVYKYDVSIPRQGEMYDPVLKLRERLKEGPAHVCCGYGHLGDGNLHINVLLRDLSGDSKETMEGLLEPFVFQVIRGMRGSISAEHGLGLMKAEKIFMQHEREHVDVMRELKKVFDPNGILNPYKLFRDPS